MPDQIPKQLKNCPIIESVAEVRFSTNIDRTAVYGVLYNALKANFEKTIPLDILQIPEQIRDADPNLKYKPYYKIKHNADPCILIQIGPDVITINNVPTYSGWDAFSKKIFEVLETVFRTEIIGSIDRIALRYINFFEGSNIFQGGTNLSIKLMQDEIPYIQTQLKTEFVEDSFRSNVTIINHAISSAKGSKMYGSVIDIDTYRMMALENAVRDIKSILNELHTYEKRTFFSLLSQEFLKSLNPVY